MGVLLDSENWIAELPERVRSAITLAVTIRELQPGEILRQTGDTPDACFQVESGLLKLMGLHPDGRPMLVRFYGPGNTFAETSVVANRAGHMHTTVAFLPTRVRCLAREDFWPLYREHPEIPEALCRKFAGSITNLFLMREEAANFKLRDRIKSMFDNLAEHWGEKEPSGRISIDLPLSHNHIAQHLDATRQAVQREMAVLQQSDLVFRRGNRWYVQC